MSIAVEIKSQDGSTTLKSLPERKAVNMCIYHSGNICTNPKGNSRDLCKIKNGLCQGITGLTPVINLKE